MSFHPYLSHHKLFVMLHILLDICSSIMYSVHMEPQAAKDI